MHAFRPREEAISQSSSLERGEKGKKKRNRRRWLILGRSSVGVWPSSRLSSSKKKLNLRWRRSDQREERRERKNTPTKRAATARKRDDPRVRHTSSFPLTKERKMRGGGFFPDRLPIPLLEAPVSFSTRLLTTFVRRPSAANEKRKKTLAPFCFPATPVAIPTPQSACIEL